MNCVPDDGVYEAYAKGAAKDIDFMQGCTKDEFHYFAGGMGAEPFLSAIRED